MHITLIISAKKISTPEEHLIRSEMKYIGTNASHKIVDKETEFGMSGYPKEE
jgi:hypothetical protein